MSGNASGKSYKKREKSSGYMNIFKKNMHRTPPMKPMKRRNKKPELCRLSAAEVSVFHSGLFSHHCR